MVAFCLVLTIAEAGSASWTTRPRSSMLVRVPVLRSFALPTGSFRIPARVDGRTSAESLVLSLVVPTYNEAVNIEPLLERIRTSLDPALRNRYEVIVVDDSSPDETWKVAAGVQACYPQLVVLRREQERGLSSAIVRGWQVAGGDILDHQCGFSTPSGIVAEDAGNGPDSRS